MVRMSLYSFPDEIFSGRVLRIYPKADPERRTFEVDVAMDLDFTAAAIHDDLEQTVNYERVYALVHERVKGLDL